MEVACRGDISKHAAGGENRRIAAHGKWNMRPAASAADPARRAEACMRRCRMPKRPSKTKIVKPQTGKSAAPGGQLADERRRQLATRATLGKFQGRKSI